MELRAQATLATRPPKEIRSLADLPAEWRDVGLGERIGGEAELWAALFGLVDHGSARAFESFTAG